MRCPPWVGVIFAVLLLAGCGGKEIRVGVISSVAGGGTGGSGDGGKATAGVLTEPADVAFDSKGNMYIVETGLFVAPGSRVRRVDADGTLTTYAGTGVHGFAGDGGPAAKAELNLPFSIAIDKNDKLYISDGGNDRIRRVDTNGVITTYAGPKQHLRSPDGMAFDNAGDLYFCDGGGTLIRRFDPSGALTTVAGTGKIGFSGDGGPAVTAQLGGDSCDVALDEHGNLYIADQGNDRVRKVDSHGVITTIAGTGDFGSEGDGGPATAATLYDPVSVAVDEHGNLYVSDHHNDRIRKIDTAGRITTFAGSLRGFSGDGRQADRAQIDQPWGVTVHNGALYFADTFNARIRKVVLR